jgi:hypothetical protein
VVEWMRCSTMTTGVGAKCFLLPGSNIHRICRNACAKIIGYNRRTWRRVHHFWDKNIQPAHGLVGQTGNRAISAADKMLLVVFFDQMEELGAPRATRLVRDFSGTSTATELRDADAALVELPACYTKRHLWRRFLLDNGWDVVLDSKGRTTEKVRLPDTAQTIKKCLSWPAFLQFWNDHYPKVVIQRAREDICDECFVFANQHRYGR